MLKKMYYHVVYSFGSGRGSITMSSDKQPVTSELIKVWKKYIQDDSKIQNVIIENFIEIKE